MSMFLVDRCDVLTVEIEHVDVATMEMLEQQGVDCQPKASTIRIIQVCFSLTLPIGYWLLSCKIWENKLNEIISLCKSFFPFEEMHSVL